MVVVDRCTNAYWVSPRPISWDIVDLTPMNTKSDPAILQIGQIVPKATNCDLNIPEITISEVCIQEVASKGQSSVLSTKDDPTLFETASTHPTQGCFEKELKVACRIDALDLAKPAEGLGSVAAPEYLNLAFIKDQEANLRSRLLAVDNGRLATVAQTLAEAYVENTKDLEISSGVDRNSDQAQSTQFPPETVVEARFNEACAYKSEARISQSFSTVCVETRESCLFNDEPRATSVTVTFPERDSECRQRSVIFSSTGLIEPLVVEATSRGILDDHLLGDGFCAECPTVVLHGQNSDPRLPLVKTPPIPGTGTAAAEDTLSSHEVLQFSRGPSKTRINLGGSFDERSVVTSSEQIHNRQLSDGNASSTTVESFVEQIHSRQPSDGNASVTTTASYIAGAVSDEPTNFFRTYPQPCVHVEEPYVMTVQPLPKGSQPGPKAVHVLRSDPATPSTNQVLIENLPTTGQAEPEKEMLSKSQKKRRRQGRKRRALAAAADQTTLAFDASIQSETDERNAETEVTLECDSQSLGPIVEDWIVAEGEQSSNVVAASVTMMALTVPARQSLTSCESQVGDSAPQTTMPVAQPSNTETLELMNTASSAQHTPLVVDMTQASHPLPVPKETIQDLINASFGGNCEDWADSVEDEPMHVETRKVFGEGNPQGKFDHSNMHFAMQHLRQPGFVQVRILQKADRSLAWFQQFFSSGSASADQVIEQGKAEDLTGSKEPVPVFTTPEAATYHPLPDFHHLNFLYEEVKNKSATPPEVSLWAAVTHTRLLNEKQGLPWACSTKAVLIAQAWQYVDPYSYAGPVELLMLHGTALRDAITGYVDKVYDTFGTWGYDYYDEDENVPRTPTEVHGWCHWNGDENYEVVVPYHMGDGDITIIWNPKPITELRKLLHYIPSTLGPERIAYDIKKAAEILAATELREANEAAECAFTGDHDLSQEEIEADNYDFYSNDPDGSDVRDEALSYAVASDKDSLMSEERDTSEEEADALAVIRKAEWLAEWSDSPDRVRNQLMNPTATPGMFKHRLITDEEQTPSEASTELNMDHDYHSDVGTDFNDHFTDDTQHMEPTALPPIFESPGDTYLETVTEEEDNDYATVLEVPVGQEVSLIIVRASRYSPLGYKLIISQIKQESSPQVPLLGSNESSMSPAEIDNHRISDAEAHTPLLSHIFPFLIKDLSALPGVTELPDPTPEVTTDAPAVHNSVVSTTNTSPESAHMSLSSSSDNYQETATADRRKEDMIEPSESSVEVYYHQIHDVETLTTSLSHIFPYLLKDILPSHEVIGLPMGSIEVLSDADPTAVEYVEDINGLSELFDEIHYHQISDVKTITTSLSHVFPFLLEEAPHSQDPSVVQLSSAEEAANAPPITKSEIAILDASSQPKETPLPPFWHDVPGSVQSVVDGEKSTTSSAEIFFHQISDAETSATPLSHVFPFLAKNDLPEPDSSGPPTVEPNHASSDTRFEVVTKDRPLNTDNVPHASSYDELPNESASKTSEAHGDTSCTLFCEIDKPQISGLETSTVPLSHVFPFLSHKVSTSQDAGEVQNPSTEVSSNPTPTTDTKNVSNENATPQSDNVAPPPSSRDDTQQQPSSEDNSLQVVLYEPRPHWFNILMLFARTLKRATSILHKSTPVKPSATEIAPHKVNLDIPDNLDLIPNRPDFNEFYFGKSTIYVGKQGIKVAKAAVQVGMLPVHAGVEVAKTPYKAAKTGWKIGSWAWSRFVRRS